jgi:preprotein translocase subunit SecA
MGRFIGSDNISGIMQRMGMDEGVPIESRLITRQIERAQSQVEARNFEIRKHLLEYDDVMNKQREEIYRFRKELLEEAEQKDYVIEMAEDLILDQLDQFADKEVDHDHWEYENLKVNFKRVFGIDIPENFTLPVPSSDNGDTETVPLEKLSRTELQDCLNS